ncbi:MAG: TetR/AcrR family transcriptional regulator, partial [Gammaproteobacteria bacterium]|nr:TetR/AcrR family transcriptional regulator [Gammaproteobacteria bacterium]
MTKATAIAAREPGHRIKQRRSQKTYEALIAAGFRLLEERELEEIPVAELAAVAGYSVGAFYARFRSKDEYFDAMIARHMDDRTERQQRLLEHATDATLVWDIVDDMAHHYWSRRRFWRAALKRSIRDPDFWAPIRQHGNDFASAVVERISGRIGRALTSVEETRIRFAFQILLGTINNTIINR